MYEIYQKLKEQKGCRDVDVSRATGIGSGVFSDWKKGRSTPKADKLQKIADFFGVSLEYLATGRMEKSESGKEYYFTDETAAAAQELFDNKDLRALMDAGRGCKPEQIQLAAEMLRRFKETNTDG